MLKESDIRELVEKAIANILKENSVTELTQEDSRLEDSKLENTIIEDGFVDDVTAIDIKEELFVPNPCDREGYMAMKQYTPARLGVWRAGPRYKTKTTLRFRADHATAQDAVFTDVSEEFIKEHKFISVKTMCGDKDEYVTRPDLGKKFSKETKEQLKNKLAKNIKVQIMVGDGLSSAAIEANVRDILPAIAQGLKAQGITVSEVPFVKYCRVGAMDEIGEITGADVVCCLIGERPGLVTAESMSAYIAYKPTVNMPEARRTVVSNIHKGGTAPAEAGAHISGLIKMMLDKKVSGVELKL